MRSFTFRITCRFAVLVTATTAVVLAIGGIMLKQQIETGIELLHDVESQELASLLGKDARLTPAGVAERIKHDADSDAALFVIQVSDTKGEIFFRSDNLGETLLPVETPPGVHRTVTLPNLGEVRLSAYVAGPWLIHIGSLLYPSHRMMQNYVSVCLPLLIGVGLISVGLGYAFSRATLQPLRAIEETANRIKADNLDERIPLPSGRDELTSLTRLLNQMFDRLQGSFEQIHRFAADASHEMKTPLSLIRLQVERLGQRFQNDPETAAAITDILEEIARLHRVIDRLLFLAKAESGALTLDLKSIDMPAFISAFAEDANVMAEDRGIRFEVGRNDPGRLTAEPELLRQLLLNLVANAAAVSPRNHVVTLDSIAETDAWRLVVTDEGPGIPDAALANLFTRFFQVNSSRPNAGSRGGSGLGLAICRSIAEIHGGTISARNRSGHSGLEVTVRFRK